MGFRLFNSILISRLVRYRPCLCPPNTAHQVEDVESKLPPKVPVVVKVAMSAYQHTVYSWIKASGGSKAGAAIAAVAASWGAAFWGEGKGGRPGCVG